MSENKWKFLIAQKTGNTEIISYMLELSLTVCYSEFLLFSGNINAKTLILSCFRFVPIFSVSAVSGANLDLILKFLNVIPPLNKDREKLVQAPTEYQVKQ